MDILEKIESLSSAEIVDAMDAAIRRYQQLFPEWEITVFSLHRKEDRNAQIDECIQLLEKLKTSR